MNTGNFPAKVLARQQGALARLKGPADSSDVIAMQRYTTEKTALTKAIGAIAGNPRNLRSKKDRRDRAKVA